MSDLLDVLLSKPVGPVLSPCASVTAQSPTRSLEVRQNAITAVLGGSEGTITEDSATQYLKDEGQNPEDWVVTGFRKTQWGEGQESVNFTFKRKVFEVDEKDQIDPSVIEAWRESLLDSEFPSVLFESFGGCYVILIADPQLGKKGTAEAVANYRRGLLAHVAQIEKLGPEVSSVHVAWMGDETENVVNSYANQPFTVELNRSQQLELDYDLRVWALKEVLGLGLPTSASSVISNHGEWTRNGGKDPVTTQGDNASTYVARQVKALFDELESFTGHHVEWFIGGGDPGVSITLDGVDCYFSHGYIEKGKGGSTELRTKSAIERQILGKTEELGATRLWFMAHYHHLYFQEFEGRTLFGCPALEAEKSSEYMLNQYGVWSPPGMLGLIVTKAQSRGWNHLNVF